MLAWSATVVSAHEVENTTDASILRAELCPDCGIGSMRYSYTDWTPCTYERQVTCTHYPVGVDVIYKRQHLITLACNYCTSVSTRTDVEQKAECRGSHVKYYYIIPFFQVESDFSFDSTLSI